jgi:KUP system potassium uptake protein
MNRNTNGSSSIQKLSLAGVIIALGIVFGDIGTSPLYVMKAIGAELPVINAQAILGSVSCIFWTLTLQTTVKYIIITLRADNKGEGGIFALFALIRKRYKRAFIFAIIGGSTLLADGIITPSITVISAIEGLKMINPQIPVITIVIIILSVLFLFQQFGTSFLGKSFGPIMVIWFSTLLVSGMSYVVTYPSILKAINPVYAIQLLTSYPFAIFILGAVFLATTGAEALYSDLGHCGIKNIRISWIFVKTALVINYFGQAVWVIQHPDFREHNANPIFSMIPEGMIVPFVILATLAAIIASQALISGSFTLISEAMSLNFWPRMKIKYPTDIKGQLFVPWINAFLWIACITVVLIFQSSSAMEAAYGLSITLTMLMTTNLLVLYLHKKVKFPFLLAFIIFYFSLESIFIIANLKKFTHGGWFTVMIAGFLAIEMYSWYMGRKIKNNLMKFTPVDTVLEILKKVRQDKSIPKFATNLIYITKADRRNEIESTIVHSLVYKQPKRADTYWFLHIDIKDDPYSFKYEVTHLIPGVVIKVDFMIGFRIEPRINLFFHQVLEDMSQSGEIKFTSHYPSLEEFGIRGDNRYVLIDRILAADHRFTFKERLVMGISDRIRHIGLVEQKYLKIDASSYIIEKVPLGVPDVLPVRMTRICHPLKTRTTD